VIVCIKEEYIMYELQNCKAKLAIFMFLFLITWSIYLDHFFMHLIDAFFEISSFWF